MVDAISAWYLGNITALAGNAAIATGIVDHFGYGRPINELEALASYINGHGIVFSDTDAIERLLAATPLTQGLIDSAIGMVGLVTDDPERTLFHVSATEHAALRESIEAYDGQTAFVQLRLPARDGFVWLAGDTETGQSSTLLGWTAARPGIDFTTTTITVDQTFDALMRGEATPIEHIKTARFEEDATDWEPESPEAAEAFATLIAFADLMEARGLADPDAEPADDARRKTKAARKKAPAPTRPVNLVYRRTERPAPTTSGVQPREWTHRWPVRGFYRRQWYPSLQEHRTIWVAAHVRGPADKPIVATPQVNVVGSSREG
ncbi:hypothetical protein GCM10025867_51460 (plasmid) [Frondihabitans sucicola]|uniref:Uncharacterized protein n=1 Tax=Frondihabitans sucicola TaxID=1268041 RepID=A0ABM8GV36_9MICO|nr:hypothetical protein [Frondihabitans sucicola]BDZ52338.1 hypothetical protein GCM10025867_45790 [Frondihabitans sucicola]BDZ52905.1 hypothetical protein GCM10025867_51460 [Frondihabitans sucicola]